MRYTVKAKFAEEFSAPARLKKRPILYSLWQVCYCPVMVVGSYLGAVGATFMFELMPSQLLACHGSNLTLCWYVSVVSLVAILGICLCLGFLLYRLLRVCSVISVDITALLLGSLLSLSYLLVFLTTDLSQWVKPQ